ncbi:hypothetical protein M406DRAFT_322293 [Cryphonectria parasitica EP155]|uniref:Uncharacterized protein n=1 Tax=Cryphonectria parasitica (strain ATCC 38755 / EP155) TaxID=660469 RepID=A0A9P4Y3F8_CRYP1|nr:uncharacterized protein M406DRAFT_322293 [Cryphonectria parasitica EP155]KAF3766252.1 hypothetical protein M406DRAFT_322293 [Cryphonectria parasitica EP155]
MKPVSYLLLFLSAIMGISAVDVQKSFIVYFNKDTPQDVVNSAMQVIKDAKGQITHEYDLINGFAATAGEKVFDSMFTWVQSNGGAIEEDKTYSTQGEGNAQSGGYRY